MKTEQTIAIVDHSLKHKLSDLQWLILKHSEQGKTYVEIADECGYSPDYIRENGAKLWQSLSLTIGTKVTKKNWLRIAKQYQISTKHLNRVLIPIKIEKQLWIFLVFVTVVEKEQL